MFSEQSDYIMVTRFIALSSPFIAEHMLYPSMSPVPEHHPFIIWFWGQLEGPFILTKEQFPPLVLAGIANDIEHAR
jgi:hypothetical protein